MADFVKINNGEMKSDDGVTIGVIGVWRDGCLRMQYVDEKVRFKFFATRLPDTEEYLAKGLAVEILPNWKVNLISRENILDGLLDEVVKNSDVENIIAVIKTNVKTALMSCRLAHTTQHRRVVCSLSELVIND